MKSLHLRVDKTVQQLLYAVILLLIACLDAGAEDNGGGLLLRTVRIKRTMRIISLAAVFILFAVLPMFHGVGFFASMKDQEEATINEQRKENILKEMAMNSGKGLAETKIEHGKTNTTQARHE